MWSQLNNYQLSYQTLHQFSQEAQSKQQQTWHFVALSPRSPFVFSSSPSLSDTSCNCCSACLRFRSDSWRADETCFSSASISAFCASSCCFAFSSTSFDCHTQTVWLDIAVQCTPDFFHSHIQLCKQNNPILYLKIQIKTTYKLSTRL